MVEAEAGRDALDHLARVWERRPSKDDFELSAATRRLAALREALILVQRRDEASDADRERLARLNAIISVVMAMHFPIGEAPWGEFDKARTWLADLLAELEH